MFNRTLIDDLSQSQRVEPGELQGERVVGNAEEIEPGEVGELERTVVGIAVAHKSCQLWDERNAQSSKRGDGWRELDQSVEWCKRALVMLDGVPNECKGLQLTRVLQTGREEVRRRRGLPLWRVPPQLLDMVHMIRRHVAGAAVDHL